MEDELMGYVKIIDSASPNPGGPMFSASAVSGPQAGHARRVARFRLLRSGIFSWGPKPCRDD